jgi:hypothetical protein
VLAIPKAVAPGEQWNEVTANSIIFDRIRLTEANHAGLDVSQSEYLENVFVGLREFAERHLV